MEKINVAAAIITKENKYFIAKRNKNKHLGGFYEFPGGKQDDNETLQETVIREIKEELDVYVCVDVVYCSLIVTLTVRRVT